MHLMTQTAFRTDPLSPELNHLINDYLRDAWDAHPNFAQSTQNCLGAHQAFCQLSDRCVSKTERILDEDMDAEHYGHILGRYGDSLVRNLHGHHTWEDRQFFPCGRVNYGYRMFLAISPWGMRIGQSLRIKKRGPPALFRVSIFKLIIIPLNQFFACGLNIVRGERTRPVSRLATA
jgi:hypothetical protein